VKVVTKKLLGVYFDSHCRLKEGTRSQGDGKDGWKWREMERRWEGGKVKG